MNSKYIILNCLALGLLISASLIKPAARPMDANVPQAEQASIDTTTFEALPDPVILNEIAPKLSNVKLKNLMATSKRYRDLLQPEFKKRSALYWSQATIESTTLRRGYYAIAEVNLVAFSPDGKTLAAGSWGSNTTLTIPLWNIQTSELAPIKVLSPSELSAFCAAFSPDGKIFATGAGDGKIYLWNTQSDDLKPLGLAPMKTLLGHGAVVLSVAFSPDGQTLASESNDGTICLWNIKTGEKILTLTGPQFSSISIAFSPDGKTLASAESQDKIIKLWNTETGDPKKEFRNHIPNSTWTSIAFSSDGKVLATGSNRGTIWLWNIKTGKGGDALTGHTGAITSIVFSPDDQTLASGSLDKTIKLWNLQRCKCIHTLAGHTKGVKSIVFSPDGQTLASGSLDKTIRLWKAVGK